MDPFFTTKEEGKGTGLGLSMVYGFLKQSGGLARIESEEDVGTTVRLYFPVDDSGTLHREPKPQPLQRNGQESILIVEDRPDVAELARVLLEDYGYATEVAYNGRDALTQLEQHNFDLLFTDLIMPGGMNGVLLAREARRRRPRIRVLLTIGYAESSIERTDAGGTEFDVIAKPYLPSDLARKIRQVLDGPTGVG